VSGGAGGYRGRAGRIGGSGKGTAPRLFSLQHACDVTVWALHRPCSCTFPFLTRNTWAVELYTSNSVSS
jgi:hypothetical protein